jgi:hypothetical protein
MRTIRLLAAVLAVPFVVVPATIASAHETHRHGDLEMEVGFGTEPAYAGQLNSVQLILSHDGRPVVDLEGELQVEVRYGDAEPLRLTMEPFFKVGEFGTPGDYRAWFVPTRPGRYSFRFTGAVHGEEVDETFTSGPRTFSDVLSPKEIEYPEQDPTVGELGERMGRIEPRLASAIDDARSAIDDARRAAAAAAGARTMGLVGLIVGAVGLTVALVAVVGSRRKVA